MSPEKFKISDRELKLIFGDTFREVLRQKNVLYPSADHGYTGNNDRLFYYQDQFAKAVCAYNKYKEQLAKHKRHQRYFIDFSGVHGIIPNEVATKMQQQPWWEEINKKIKKTLPEYANHDDPLSELIKPYTMETIAAYYRRRRSRRVVKF